jgi:hypothetical protein
MPFMFPVSPNSATIFCYYQIPAAICIVPKSVEMLAGLPVQYVTPNKYIMWKRRGTIFLSIGWRQDYMEHSFTRCP